MITIMNDSRQNGEKRASPATDLDFITNKEKITCRQISMVIFLNYLYDSRDRNLLKCNETNQTNKSQTGYLDNVMNDEIKVNITSIKLKKMYDTVVVKYR